MKFKSDIEVQAGLKDSSGSNGTSGQILSSNGSTVSWIAQGSSIASDVQNQVKAGVAINKGQAVYVTGADGTNIIVGLASNTSEATSSKTLGLLNATVAINGFADVVQIGRLAGLNTIGAVAGDPVWLGTNGNLIYGLINKPYAPAHLVFLGIVTRVNANNGEIFVNVQNGFELNEIHDVDLKTTVPVNGDVLGFNGTLWVNKTIAQWLGYTPANANGTVNYVSKFTGATTLGDSQIFDNGTNVGIGTSNPNAYPYGEKLSVNGNISIGGTKIGFGTTDSFVAYGWYSAAHYGISWAGNNPLALSGYYGLGFFTNGSEKMRVTPGGEVGIGTTTPYYKTTISGNPRNTDVLCVASNQIDSDATQSYVGISLQDQYADGGGNASAIRSYSNLYSQWGSALTFSTTGTSGNGVYERMRITASGNVGIGTTNPLNKLTIQSDDVFNQDSGGQIVIKGSTSTTKSLRIGFDTTSNYGYIQSIDVGVTSRPFVLQPFGGNVGIGTTSPSDKLTIQDSLPILSVLGTSSGGTGTFGYRIKDGGNNLVDFTYNSATGENKIGGLQSYVFPTFYSGGSERMRITSSGNVGIGLTSPNPSALLHLKSTTQGFLPPVMRTGERDSIGSPAAGLMIFNEDDEVVQVFTNGSGWKTLAWA